MVKLSEVKVGQEFVDVVKNITREQITKYGNASGDRNPIHMDEKFATDVAGLKGVIAHGLLWMGFVGKFLTQLVDNGKIIKWGGQFRGQVRPGGSAGLHLGERRPGPVRADPALPGHPDACARRAVGA